MEKWLPYSTGLPFILKVTLFLFNFTSCTTLYFKAPIPEASKTINDIPDIKEGLYISKRNYFDTDLLISIIRLKKGHYSIITLTDIKRDRITVENNRTKKIIRVKIDSFKDHKLFQKALNNLGKDRLVVYQIKNRNYTIYAPVYTEGSDEGYIANMGFNGQLNFKEGWYKHYKGSFSNTDKTEPLIVKKSHDRYFLNFFHSDLEAYSLCLLTFRKNEIKLKHSVLVSKKFFLENVLRPVSVYQDNIKSILRCYPWTLNGP